MDSSITRLSCVILGNSNVGKSSLLSRFVKNTFNNKYYPTTAMDLVVKDIYVNNRKTKVYFWDITGFRTFDSLARQVLNKNTFVFILFDTTNPHSFADIDEWYSRIIEYYEDITIVIIGNKIDLPNRMISYSTGCQKASELGCRYLETSLKFESDFYNILNEIINKVLLNLDSKNPTKNIIRNESDLLLPKKRSCFFCC